MTQVFKFILEYDAFKYHNSFLVAMAVQQLKIMYNNIKALNEVCEMDKVHFSVFKLYNI